MIPYSKLNTIPRKMQGIHFFASFVLLITTSLITSRSLPSASRSSAAWDAFCGRHVAVGDWVTVYTKDGLEYKGRLSSYGFGESKKEITMSDPKLILRDKTGKATRKKTYCGQEMIFTEGDVLRIAALTSRQVKKPVAAHA